MSTALPALILDMVLGHLALLFLTAANGDQQAARQAAHQMLTAYHPQTPDELTLAAEVVCFSFQAMEALSQANAPDLSMTRLLRLRGSAVSLSRQAHKSRRRLDQLKQARLADGPVPELSPSLPPVEATRPTAQPPAKTSTPADQHRENARRITESLKNNQARHNAALATAAPPQYAAAGAPAAQPPHSPLLPMPRPASAPAENVPSHP